MIAVTLDELGLPQQCPSPRVSRINDWNYSRSLSHRRVTAAFDNWAIRMYDHLFALVLRLEPAAGKKIGGGALAASDGAVHRPVVSVEIRRFAGKEQGIPNWCG